MSESILYYFNIDTGFTHSCCEGMTKRVTAEMRQEHLRIITFQKLLIVAVPNNPFDSLIKCTLMLNITESVDEDKEEREFIFEPKHIALFLKIGRRQKSIKR